MSINGDFSKSIRNNFDRPATPATPCKQRKIRHGSQKTEEDRFKPGSPYSSPLSPSFRIENLRKRKSDFPGAFSSASSSLSSRNPEKINRPLNFDVHSYLPMPLNKRQKTEKTDSQPISPLCSPLFSHSSEEKEKSLHLDVDFQLSKSPSENQRKTGPELGEDYLSTDGMLNGTFTNAPLSRRDMLRLRVEKDRLAREKAQEARLPHFIVGAKKYNKDLKEIIKDDKRIQSIEEKEIGIGDFVKAFRANVKAGNKPELQVIKIPHFRKCHVGEDGEKILMVLAYELKQYIQLTDDGFPINDHYNFDEFLTRDGTREFYRSRPAKDPVLLQHLRENFSDAFYRVEFVPHQLEHGKMVAEYNKMALEMSPREFFLYQEEMKEMHHPLYQIKKMFQYAWENNIPLDIKPANLRLMDDEKGVLLCDLYYKEEPFSMGLVSLLQHFSGFCSPIWAYLCPQGPLGGEGEDAVQFLARQKPDFKKLIASSANV